MLCTKFPKRDSAPYLTLLNIKRFDTVLKCFCLKIRKNDNNINYVRVIVLNTASGNQASMKLVIQTKQMLEKTVQVL